MKSYILGMNSKIHSHSSQAGRRGMWHISDSLGCCSCGGWLLSGAGMSCVWDCDSGCDFVCTLACGLWPLAQVTKQNPVVGLAQADSNISLKVEHSSVFCSSSNRHNHRESTHYQPQ